MGITDTVFGTPGQTQVHQTAGSKPPGFNFARDFFNSLGGIAQNPYPTYQGQIDPGLSPTLQNLMRQAQGYSQAGPPEIMAGVQGSLGRFMNPSFMNPVARMQQGGAPDYFNQNPNQTVWNGGNVGGLAGVFGAGQSGSKMSGAGVPAGQTPPWGGQVNEQPGFQLPNGQPNQTPPYFNPQASGLGGAMGNVGQSMSEQPMVGNGYNPGLDNAFRPNGQFPLNAPWPTGGTPPTGSVDWNNIMGGENAANNAHPGMPGPAGQPGQGGGRTYGGYTAQQLQGDPSLVARLGQHAAGLWRAFQPGGGQGGPNMMHPTNPGAPRQPGQPGLPTKPNRDPRRGGIMEMPGVLK